MRLLLFFLLFFNSFVFSQESELTETVAVRISEDGPIHEAFVEPIKGEIILQAIANPSPPQVDETIPPQQSQNTIWIPGYWAWLPEKETFVWVSGIWRNPPPGMTWISGYWTSFEEGWVRLPGFWSAVSQSNLVYLPDAPPPPIDEEVSDPPDSDYFWKQGYWYFSSDEGKYVWIPGFWEQIDPNWVLVPDHYIWRSQGYIFIPAYWDWPLSLRGQMYSPVYLDLSAQTYLPSMILDNTMLIQWLTLDYPDYIYAIYPAYYFYPNEWSNFAPPWWAWTTWWGLSWNEQWGLWWWYTHPAFPPPAWMNDNLAKKIVPPNSKLRTAMQKKNRSTSIFPQGIASRKELDQAKKEEGLKSSPILPAQPKQMKQLIQRLTKPNLQMQNIRPIGERISQEKPPAKPHAASKDLSATKTTFDQRLQQAPKKPENIQTIPIPQKKIKKTEATEAPMMPSRIEKIPEERLSPIKTLPQNIPEPPKVPPKSPKNQTILERRQELQMQTQPQTSPLLTDPQNQTVEQRRLLKEIIAPELAPRPVVAPNIPPPIPYPPQIQDYYPPPLIPTGPIYWPQQQIYFPRRYFRGHGHRVFPQTTPIIPQTIRSPNVVVPAPLPIQTFPTTVTPQVSPVLPVQTAPNVPRRHKHHK